VVTRFWCAEAQQYFTAQAQKELVSLVSTDVVATEQAEGCSSEGVVMPGGFGRSQSQRRVDKTALQENRQLSVVPQQPVQEPDVNLAMQAEVEAFFAQYQQEHQKRRLWLGRLVFITRWQGRFAGSGCSLSGTRGGRLAGIGTHGGLAFG
jgi:hypothetical protein